MDLYIFIILALNILTGAFGQEFPVWRLDAIEGTFRIEVLENSPIGTVLGSVQAENSNFYGVSSDDILLIDGLTGVFRTTQILDREVQSDYFVTFYAITSTGTFTVSATLVVLDVNDNEPQFLNSANDFDITVSGDTRNGATIYDEIWLIDNDIGQNGDLTLSCVPTGEIAEVVAICDMFRFSWVAEEGGRFRGSVILNQDLTYNWEDSTKNQLTFILKAEDKGIPPRSSSLVMTVTVTQGAQQKPPPSILDTPISFSVFENASPELPVIKARSGLSSSISPVVIRMKSDPGNYFSIGDTIRREGGIYVASISIRQPLDREQVQQYVFTVEAVEEEQSATASITVNVRDINDNGPVFDQEVYSISISESMEKGTIVPGFSMTLEDADEGDNSFLEVELSGRDSEYFYLQRTSPLTLRLLENLDYDNVDTRQLQLLVRAQETQTAEQRSSSATIIINVEDANDNFPQFTETSYQAYVREDRQPNTINSIITITADDLDSGLYGELTYALYEDTFGVFGVNNKTGSVYLLQSLDFETKDEYNLRFEATDGGGQSVSVPLTVYILDYNDQAPAFQLDQYRTSVDETSTLLQPSITVKATDQETDEDVTYAIIDGNIGNAFVLGPITGVLTLTRPVTYDETLNGLITLTVEASDNGSPPQKSTVPIIISVQDVNGHDPRFVQLVYRRTIVETDPPAMSVIRVQATDEDTGLNGDIEYVIASGSRDNFEISPTSGLIIIDREAVLDIDVNGDRYQMTVLAVDRGSPSRTATAQVIVSVLGANNKPPAFFPKDVYYIINDRSPINTPVGNVNAVDPDDGAVIRYRIIPDSISARDRSGQPVTSTDPIDFRTLFAVDPVTGGLTTTGQLDRDYVAEVSFVVEAQDIQALPAIQTGTADVTITIRSSTGDGGLSFNPPWTSENPVLEVFIPEEEPVATLVTTVIAQDPETGQQITDYRKVPESDPQEFFIVNRESGRIYLNKRMDYENPSTRQRTFRVQAFTPSPNSRSAMATITVKTQDINDHDPAFGKESYEFDASESLNPGGQIGVVTATDKDSGEFGRITFSLFGQNSDFFRIDPDQGSIEVADNMDLNREWIPDFYLTVRAQDQGGKYSEVPLYVRVLDENDNRPEFTSPEYNMYTLEYVGVSSSLGQVHANDKDTGANGAVTYRIIDGNDMNLFKIDTVTGIIRSNLDLVGYARETPYTLTVQAEDGGSPPTTSTTIVQIRVTDVQTYDGRPKIEFPPKDGLEIELPEDRPPGTNITTIIATDTDLGPEGELTYGFVANDALDEDHSYFNIDPVTGEITIKEDLDRETKDTYELLVYVEDGGNPPNRVTRKIIIRVLDVDDNEPCFVDCTGCPDLDMQNPMNTNVKENAPVNTQVTTVTACDADGPPNNKLYYYIIGGNELYSDGTDSTLEAFSINSSSGAIYTKNSLDRERKPQYVVRVYASNIDQYPDLENIDPGAVLNLVIDLDDVNDNGPDFTGKGATGSNIVAGIPTNWPYGTEVIQIQAADADADYDYTYSITGISYTNYKQRTSAVDVAHFLIDPDTGIIRTGLENYDKYIGGNFKVFIQAKDSQDRRARAELVIYVLSSQQRLKFVFNGSPQVIKDTYMLFINDLNKFLSAAQINADSLGYGIDEEGKALYNETQVCFHIVEDNRVVSQKDSLSMLKDLKRKNGAVEQLHISYKVIDTNVCEPHVTTIWWSGWWWLWWLLIALALFIILVCIIVLLILFCCSRKCFGYAQPEKPYIVLDPYTVVNPSYGHL